MPNHLHEQLEKSLEKRASRRVGGKRKMRVSGKSVMKLQEIIKKKADQAE